MPRDEESGTGDSGERPIGATADCELRLLPNKLALDRPGASRDVL